MTKFDQLYLWSASDHCPECGKANKSITLLITTKLMIIADEHCEGKMNVRFLETKLLPDVAAGQSPQSRESTLYDLAAESQFIKFLVLDF